MKEYYYNLWGEVGNSNHPIQVLVYSVSQNSSSILPGNKVANTSVSSAPAKKQNQGPMTWNGSTSVYFQSMVQKAYHFQDTTIILYNEKATRREKRGSYKRIKIQSQYIEACWLNFLPTRVFWWNETFMEKIKQLEN